MSALQVLSRATQTATDFALTTDAALVLMDDGTARVIDMRDRFYSIPKIGTLMLQHTLEHGSAAAAEWIAAEFGIERQQAAADVHRFLSQLVDRGVIQRTSDENTNLPKATLTARVLARAARVALKCLPTRKRRIRGALALAKLSFRLCGWTATRAAWDRCFPQRDRGVTAGDVESLASRIDLEVCNAAAGNLLGAECKERGLVCWALARTAGLVAELKIGVVLYPLGGHCWCEVESLVISDLPANCKRYTPVLSYA